MDREFDNATQPGRKRIRVSGLPASRLGRGEVHPKILPLTSVGYIFDDSLGKDFGALNV